MKMMMIIVTGLSLEPLIGAIAAGNAVVLKPSELAPASSSALAALIHKYLDTKAIKVVEGGVSVGEQLLQQKWDKIFFTGDFFIIHYFIYLIICGHCSTNTICNCDNIY